MKNHTYQEKKNLFLLIMNMRFKMKNLKIEQEAFLCFQININQNYKIWRGF